MKTWKDLTKADKIVIALFVAMFLAYGTCLVKAQTNVIPTINKTLLQKTR